MFVGGWYCTEGRRRRSLLGAWMLILMIPLLLLMMVSTSTPREERGHSRLEKPSVVASWEMNV